MNLRSIVTGAAMLCFAGAASAQYGYDNRPRGGYGYGGRDPRMDQGYDRRPRYGDQYQNDCFTNSILSFAPIQLTENGVGMSVSWERNLDRYGYITFNCPAVLTFNLGA